VLLIRTHPNPSPSVANSIHSSCKTKISKEGREPVAVVHTVFTEQKVLIDDRKKGRISPSQNVTKKKQNSSRMVAKGQKEEWMHI
jgi:hypothetical protein